jgi:hypothetical protein
LDAREVGKELFGRRDRLPLLLWIAAQDKPRFFQSQPPREVIVQSAIKDELERLIRLGMLVEERPDEGRRVYYVRTDSPLWKIVDVAAEVMTGSWNARDET